MRRLLILTPHELTQDVRARRQAVAGRARRLDTVGLCIALASETPAPLDGIPVVRLRGDQVSASLRRMGLGGPRRSRPLVRELRGLWRLGRLAATTLRLARAARRLGRFDVVHANDLDALPAGWLVARRGRSRLVYDAHELYALMEPDPPRAYWSVVSRLERALARRATVVTNCDLFADDLHRRLGLPRLPLVVLNCPDRVEELAPALGGHNRLRVVYQAAVDHPGRPVSDLLEAARLAGDIELTIRVVYYDEEATRREIERLGLDGRVRLEAPVPVDELVPALSSYDVGLIINRPGTPNEELAVPGKLFEYMMAGLAVVVPRLPGLAFVEREGLGLTFEPGDAADLAAALERLAADRELLDEIRERARRLALERYNAEEQARTLAAAWQV